MSQEAHISLAGVQYDYALERLKDDVLNLILV